MLIDPCLLALLIVKESLPEAKKFQLIVDGESYLHLLGAGKDRMQQLVDALSNVLDYSGEKIECHYVGNEKIVLFKEFLHGNGHLQTQKILNKFQFLRKSCSNSETGLKDRIVNNVLPDAVAWIPIEIKNVFENLSAD